MPAEVTGQNLMGVILLASATALGLCASCMRAHDQEERILRGGDAEVESNGMSPEARAALNALAGKDIERVSSQWGVLKTPPASSKAFEVFEIHFTTRVVSDTDRYWLWVDPVSGWIWVMKSGGFLGETEWRGPVMLTSDGGFDIVE